MSKTPALTPVEVNLLTGADEQEVNATEEIKALPPFVMGMKLTRYAEKAIELKPDDAAAHLNLGILCDIYLKHPAEALAQYREYQRIAGSNNLMVAVWIKQLEVKMQPTNVASASASGAMP